MFEELVDVRESNMEAGKDRKRKALGADEEDSSSERKGFSLWCW